MTTALRHMLLGLLVAALCVGSAPSQGEQGETVDDVSGDVDVLEQMSDYDFTVDQLKQIVPILQELEAKRKTLEDYKRSEEALAPMRALRDALIKGETTEDLYTGMQGVWEKLEELDTALLEAVPSAMRKIAALLTDDQLTMLGGGDDWAYEEADDIFSTLDSVRAFNDETFNAWRDRTARQLAFRAAGESEDKAAQVQASVKEFLDKVRKLNEDQFYEQSDDLFEELQIILSESQPAPIREVAEAEAAEQLEFIMNSERALPLVEAQIKARGGGG